MVLYELRNSPAWQVCYTNPPNNGYHDGPSNTVTNVTNWPAPGTIDIANYDHVWDMRFDQAACSDPNPTCAQSLTAAQKNELRNFMQQGGTVFLMGDNGGFDARNQGIVELVNSVIPGGGFAGGSAGNIGVLNLAVGCCADVNAGASSGAENFVSDYKDMTCGGSNPNARILTEFPGVVRLSQLGTGRPVYQSNGLADFDAGPDEVGAIGVAFLGSDMLAQYSNSKLFIWFDWQTFRDQYCSPCGETVGLPSGTYANSILVRNIMDFLVVANETPTFTPTNTRTFTPTNTRTFTPTDTATFTPTNTSTDTFTFTITNTWTNTITNIFTNTVTNTRTNTPTNTITNTFTDTPTRTWTPTETWTGTPPPTWTWTNTFTDTFTRTSTNTPTQTFTTTDTPSPTSTDTNKNTYTLTNTRTNTPTWTDIVPASPTNPATFTNTRTYTNTPTDTNTPTNTNTWTQTNTHTFTFTLTNTFTFTNTATETFTATDTATPTATPTITMTLPPYPYIINIDIYNEAVERVRNLVSTRASILISEAGLYADSEGEVTSISTDKFLQIKIPGLETPETNGAGETIFIWDVKNNGGQYVKNGVYYIVITKNDMFGHKNVLTKSISVINTGGWAEVRIFNNAGELVKIIKHNSGNLPDKIKLDFEDIIPVEKNKNIILNYGENPGNSVI